MVIGGKTLLNVECYTPGGKCCDGCTDLVAGVFDALAQKCRIVDIIADP